MVTKAPSRRTLPEERRVLPLFVRLSPQRPRQVAAGYVTAVLGSVALTLSLLPFRDDITPLSKGFGFLIVVVVAAAVGGLGPGIVASILGFLTFNFFFLPPYNTFIIGRGEYVVVLFVFLGLSILISALLARATERAHAAETREAELHTLQDLSAELVAAVPGPRTYESTLSRLLQAFGFSAGALFVQDPTSRDLLERVTVGVEPGGLTPRWNPATDNQAPERLPLSVGGRNLGLFVLQGDRPPLNPAESRVMRSFCDQFAMVLERDRLLRTATDAEVFRQSDEVRRSLVTAVSHDLRTPLAAIKASVTDLLARDAEREDSYVVEALETINKETDRLASMVANLLDMSRIEGGMYKARVQVVDLPEILATCVDRVLGQDHELRIRVRCDEGASFVRADPAFLDRVVTNLLDNAAKASRDQRTNEIEVEASSANGQVVVRVIDHGPGIPAPVREQLFFPFYRISERHPRLGTGLGLAIVKGFLTLMNGEAWIEDTPGSGATFAFSLPAGSSPE